MPQTLLLILLLLAASVLVVTICRRVRLPPILGYLIVGIALGPHALGVVPDDASTRRLAEFGIVFLMFSIGLEFSLPQLRTMRRAVFGLGFSQVAITTIASMIVVQLLGYGWRAGVVLGGALAMSSTAIVSKMLAERSELGTPHGRDIMGILLFQDLAVVAFLILIPSLAGSGTNLFIVLAVALTKAALALAIILFFGQRPMRAWFHVVARQRSPELFVLNVLLVTLGMAELTELAGLSLALGAFLAGMLISETEFRYQVEEDIKPFRDVLLGLFFVTIGMMLDLRGVALHPLELVALLVVPVGAKLLLIVLLARAFGATLATALRTGFYLAQAGEFALVMLALASSSTLLSAEFMQVVLASMILSMLIAPLLIENANAWVRRLTANDWLARAAEVTQVAAFTMARQGHVIVCGFGRSGQNLTRLLEREDIAYLALDSDPQRVREAGDGRSVVYGDASRRETLLAAGATEVVPEVLEGSLMLASHSLLVLGVPLNRVLQNIRSIREERYGLFRGFFHGITDHEAADNLQPRLRTVLLHERAHAIGRSLDELGIRAWVEVTGVRRRGARSVAPDAEWRFEAGDAVVLLGRPRELGRAEQRLLEGE